jgi:hypothetical protein
MINIEVRNDKFWEYIPSCLIKHIPMPELGIEVIGYFPYHTARIRPCEQSHVLVPRSFFHEFETLLKEAHIEDNKVVYICKGTGDRWSSHNFAIMFKDTYAIVGTWEHVVTYANGPLKVNTILIPPCNEGKG